MFHLVRRFFGYVLARPLSPSEQQQVQSALSPQLCELFFSQAPQDQRHAIQVLERVSSNDPALAEAALLHDIGKRGLRIGAVERSLATVAGATSMPMPERWRRYLDHGAAGGDLLESAGAGNLAIAFARFHPGPVPEGIDDEVWALLTAADDA